jgi:hypothetical protein
MLEIPDLAARSAVSSSHPGAEAGSQTFVLLRRTKLRPQHADADRLERVLRGIWAHNDRLGRARVHRKGKVLVVAWNDAVSPSCWQAVNAEVVERLTAL